MFVGLWFKALNFNITFRTGGRHSTFPPWHYYLQILYINFILSAMLLRNSKSRKKILNTLDVAAAALHFICIEKPIERVHFVILLQISATEISMENWRFFKITSLTMSSLSNLKSKAATPASRRRFQRHPTTYVGWAMRKPLLWIRTS